MTVSARAIFVADKLARLRAAERERAPLSPQKLDHYRRSRQMLARRGPQSPYLDEIAGRLKAQSATEGACRAQLDRAEALRQALRDLVASTAALQEQTDAVQAQARQALSHSRRRRQPRRI